MQKQFINNNLTAYKKCSGLISWVPKKTDFENL